MSEAEIPRAGVSRDGGAGSESTESTTTDVPEAGIPEAGARDLDAATVELRAQPTAMTRSRVSSMLDRVWSTPRVAQLVRAADPASYLRISTVALVAVLRQRIDETLDHGAVQRIRLEASRDEELEGVAVQLVVQYGHDIRVLAARTLEVTEQVVAELLGRRLPAEAITTHVHVADLTRGDPHLVDPLDEA